MRLFVSVDLPEPLLTGIAAVQDELREASGLSFTDPAKAHVTLKFLGETDQERLTELQDALSASVDRASVEPFEATVSGLGAFPSEDYIRVVWVGFEAGGEPLRQLHGAIESQVTALGFEPEAHDFTPHVTIARMEHAGGKSLVQRVLHDRNPTVGTMTVDEVRLTKSELGPGGPEYTTVARFPLPAA